MMKLLRWLALSLLVAGCGGLTRLDAVPASIKEETTVLGQSDLRYWGDETSTKMLEDAIQSYFSEVAAASGIGSAGRPPASGIPRNLRRR